MQIPVFILFFLTNSVLCLIYVFTQMVLVLYTLSDKWPLGEIFFGFVFFILSILSYFILSLPLCQLSSHYIDGTFIGSTMSLLSVMMIYKYWDTITSDDLEYSISGNNGKWHNGINFDQDSYQTNFDKSPFKSEIAVMPYYSIASISAGYQDETNGIESNKSFFY